jgi:NADH dehydrogenase/NADH:ubiquinone oxidoreductase subunit G
LIAALDGKATTPELGKAAELLKAAKKPFILYGKGVTADLVTVKALYDLTGKVSASARMLSVKGKANSLAAAQYGLEKDFVPAGYKAVYIALGDEKPSERLLEQLSDKKFLAVQASYASALTALADVVLPVAEWVEQPGHYLNTDGRLQEAKKAIKQPDEVRDNVEVLKDLADRLGVKTDDKWQAGLKKLVAPVEIS